jgi:phosphatidylinositol alpha-1,6-mannosyltransferase
MPAKPRLLLITPDFPPARGGIQVLAHRLATGLEGFETKVITRDSSEASKFDAADDLEVRRVKADRRLGGGRNLPLNAMAFLEACRFRPQATLSAHLVTSPAAALVHRSLGAPTLQYFHAKEVGAKPRLAAFAAREAQDLIAVSAYTAGLVGATGSFSADMHLISPGVDLPLDSAPLAERRPTFLTIARLEDRYKGHDVLVRALPLIRAKVPDARWVVIGDGPLRTGLEQLAHAHDVAESVSFLGAVSDEQRNLWLRRAHVLAMPSRLPAGHFAGEGFGIVYLEAAAYGKPVVAGNVAGALDAVADGETGLLVDPTDPLAVAEAITSLLLDPELARALGDAGAARARGFAWPAICARVEAVLRKRLGLSPGNTTGSRASANSAEAAA